MASSHQPAPTSRDYKSIMPVAMWGLLAITVLVIAGAILLWSPWSDDSSGSNLPTQERIAPSPPAAAGTPNP